MQMKSVWRLCVFGVLFSVALFSAPSFAKAPANDKPALYTYVSEWAVPRAMWADYLKMDEADTADMKKALSDGTIVGFGAYAVLNHQEGHPTHGTWFSATSMANLMKVLEALRTAPDATSPVLAASKHWDYILESRDYAWHSGTFTNGYLRVAQWQFSSGASDPGGKLMRASIGSMLDKLLADGAIHGYQIDHETVHSSDPNVFDVAIVTNGAEGLDKFSDAIDETEKQDPTIVAAFDSMIEAKGHRDMLARASIVAHK
jgi:hypothetical protein